MEQNKLGTASISSLLRQLAIPAVIANVVNALYNIVDQIFIGQGIGYLGNAATNVAFPVTTLCLALGLMIGLGAAARFNLELGRGKQALAQKVLGNAFTTLVVAGVVLCLVLQIFLGPLLTLFGATESIYDLALTYTSVSIWGAPFLLFAIGSNPLVRADGSSTYSMMAIISGAVVNTLLDPLFIFSFGWGMAGAAWATVLGQFVSALILALYLPRFKSVRLQREDFRLQGALVRSFASLGMASFIFQSSNLLVQIVTNQSLRFYGESSIYGSEIPIAVAGIVSKINVIMISLIIGIVQGSQPILSFNYGAQNWGRVRETIRIAIAWVSVIGFGTWAAFETFPYEFLALFGSGSHAYFEFGIAYMRAFFLFSFVNGVQIFSATYFPAIGQAKIGAKISLLKQLGLILPLLLLMPRFFGVAGLAYAMPLADFTAFVVAGWALWKAYGRLGFPFEAKEGDMV
ncbi:MATE family efflux transporter [Streptococcus danieliae]|uniref:Multidrug export protein MepA n=1 Tax=Streptococcus danieliae TaxID=747656 RepID=A0A7X3KCA7_9STRE|nr:MATE family efflux transporter [Streptococcus danieliae]MVX58737.1 MATE family efflux transporter [Streptococcus danieliae]